MQAQYLRCTCISVRNKQMSAKKIFGNKMGLKYKHKLAVIEFSTCPKAQATKNCFWATENSQSTRPNG